MLIDVHEANLRQTNSEAILLDVREVSEWDAGHAPSAVNEPMSVLTCDNLDPDAEYLVICRSGGRSAKMVTLMTDYGLNAIDVAGGMQAWMEAGLPMTRDGDEPPTVA